MKLEAALSLAKKYQNERDEFRSALEELVEVVKDPKRWCSNPKCGCDTIRAVRYAEVLLQDPHG